MRAERRQHGFAGNVLPPLEVTAVPGLQQLTVWWCAAVD